MSAPPVHTPSPEQRAVIDYRDGHMQVIACAGSGKTEAISRRVARLIEEGSDPASIIAFTFTERAAESLKTRIVTRVREAMGSEFLDRLGPMFVGTIHAYCLRMLQEHVPAYGNFDILDENRFAGLLSREHRRLGLDRLGPKHWNPIHEFKRSADVAENELIPPDSIPGDFGDCYRQLRARLEEYHFLTYGQLISRAIEALADPLIYEKVQGPLRHLIVDEYQDVNPAQERLIELLAMKPVHLIVVGDDDQAIYQWRGSDVGNIQDFISRYGAKPTSLSVNRRSRPGIIKAANTFAQTITPRLEKEMLHHREHEDVHLHTWAADTDSDEGQTIANTILLLHERGYRYKDIAVLFRSVRTSAAPLLSALEARGIPFRCAGRTGLFLQQDAQLLGQTVAWLVGNDWKSERFGESGVVTLDGLIADSELAFNEGNPIPELRPFLIDWKDAVGDNGKQANLVRDLYKLLNILGVQQWDLDNVDLANRMGVMARFSQILADFENVTRRSRFEWRDGEQTLRPGQFGGVWYYRRLFNYLQYYALEAYEDFSGEEDLDVDAVDVLTIHQSKGLEWPVVFIPSMVDGRFPSKRSGQPQDWLIDESVFPRAKRARYEGSDPEERRLFYVAMTRARDMVYLSCFTRKKNRFRPSPYLLEVAGGAPTVQHDLPLPPTYAPSDTSDDLPTLSFSELASYEDCPNRYRLSTSIGFQPQLVPELGYGKSVHHLLRRLAQETKAKGRLPTLQEIQVLLQRDFFLPFANPAAYDMLYRAARRAIDTYMTTYGDELRRLWATERPFELHLENGIVNGRADVILDYEGGRLNSLALVDYKTSTDARREDIFAFQLAIYAEAGRGEGLDVSAAYLHDLKANQRKEQDISATSGLTSRERAVELIRNLRDRNFPARPERDKCRRCDVRAVCGHAACSKYDL